MNHRLVEIYDQLFHAAKTEIQDGQGLSIDSFLLKPAGDNRRGMTLLIRPSAEIMQALQRIQHQIQAVLPNQYFYPLNDLHFTVLSLVSCTPDFDAKELSLRKYIDLVQEAIFGHQAFQLNLRGLTMTRSAIMAQGFFPSGSLDHIRDHLRTVFHASDLYHTIDRRYKLETAHSTLIRFSNSVLNRAPLLPLIEQLRQIEIGAFPVTDLQLVSNDWYLRQQHTHLLATFPLH